MATPKRRERTPGARSSTQLTRFAHAFNRMRFSVHTGYGLFNLDCVHISVVSLLTFVAATPLGRRRSFHRGASVHRRSFRPRGGGERQALFRQVAVVVREFLARIAASRPFSFQSSRASSSPSSMRPRIAWQVT